MVLNTNQIPQAFPAARKLHTATSCTRFKRTSSDGEKRDIRAHTKNPAGLDLPTTNNITILVTQRGMRHHGETMEFLNT